VADDHIDQKAGDHSTQIGKVSGSLNIFNTMPKIVIMAIVLITIVLVSGYNIRIFLQEFYELSSVDEVAVAPSNSSLVSAPTSTPDTPFPTPSATSDPSIPTATPSPIPEFAESFESYNSDQDLLKFFWVNNAEKANEGSLRLAESPHISAGEYGLAFHFNIRNPQSELNYSGIERVFPPVNLSKYSLLCVWIESDTANQDLDFVIQFGEANPHGEPQKHIWKKEVWVYKIPLSSTQSGDLCMSLTKTFFHRVDWSAIENDQIDLEMIDYYGFFVEGPQGPGIIYLDNIRVE
jgi:hypothetical protein